MTGERRKSRERTLRDSGSKGAAASGSYVTVDKPKQLGKTGRSLGMRFCFGSVCVCGGVLVLRARERKNFWENRAERRGEAVEKRQKVEKIVRERDGSTAEGIHSGKNGIELENLSKGSNID